MASGQKHRLDPSDLNNAQYLTLDFYPLSKEAYALGAKLHELIIGPKVKTKGAGRPPKVGAIGNAALVTVAEIIDVAKGNIERTVHHGLSTGKFSGRQISYRHFKPAIDGLERLGMVKIRKGSWNKASMFADADNTGTGFGHNTNKIS